jgi:hypothetical protein
MPIDNGQLSNTSTDKQVGSTVTLGWNEVAET